MKAKSKLQHQADQSRENARSIVELLRIGQKIAQSRTVDKLELYTAAYSYLGASACLLRTLSNESIVSTEGAAALTPHCASLQAMADSLIRHYAAAAGQLEEYEKLCTAALDDIARDIATALADA